MQSVDKKYFLCPTGHIYVYSTKPNHSMRATMSILLSDFLLQNGKNFGAQNIVQRVVSTPAKALHPCCGTPLWTGKKISFNSYENMQLLMSLYKGNVGYTFRTLKTQRFSDSFVGLTESRTKSIMNILFERNENLNGYNY